MSWPRKRTRCAPSLSDSASAATNALMFGNIKFAGQLLRHSNESMTLRHYIELTDQMEEDSWDAYRQAYGY